MDIENSKNKLPKKYPKIPPKTENVVAIRKILKNSSFFAKTIGTIITSGGIGKNELSTKDIKAKKGFDNLCLANSKHLSYNLFNIYHLYRHVRKKRNEKF